MPRIDFSETRQKIARLRQALRLSLPVALERGIRAGHEKHLKVSTPALAGLFGAGHYVRDGQIVETGEITERWRTRKVRLGKSPNRGIFTGTLLKAIHHPYASKRTRTGWTYDIRDAGKLVVPPVRNATKRGRAMQETKKGALKAFQETEYERVLGGLVKGIASGDAEAAAKAMRKAKRLVGKTGKKTLRDSAGHYLDDYVAEKAPGLGELLPKHEQAESAAVARTTQREFMRVVNELGLQTSANIIRLPLIFKVRP